MLMNGKKTRVGFKYKINISYIYIDTYLHVQIVRKILGRSINRFF